MKVFLSVVPADNGDAEFVRKVEMPSVPGSGQYITISIGEDSGLEHYRVLRFHSWTINHPEPSNGGDDLEGDLDAVTVEVKPVRGPALTDHHRRICDQYDISESFERPFL